MIRNGLGWFYTDDGANKFFYYPETQGSSGWAHYTPTLWVDGIDEITGSWSSISYTRTQYLNMLTAHQAVPSPLAMDMQVEYGAKADTGTVHVEVVATDSIPFPRARLRLAIVESGLPHGVLGIYNQMLRGYFPNTLGILVIIAEGDTFSQDVDFVIEPAWIAENCDIVAYVQWDNTREVFQAVQAPVIGPAPTAPDQVSDVTVELVEDDLLLRWSPVVADTNGIPMVVDHYQIYRDTVAFLGPGPNPFAATGDTFYLDDSGAVGDADTHYYYAVTAVAGGKESGFPGSVGEFDRHLATGK